MLPKFLRPLASIGLTVVLLVLIAIAMVYGTTYESMVGTPLAQADVYHSMWFDILLGLLALNLVSCTLNRYPYRPHQAGWIMTHIGILIILTGAVISRNWGIEGSMTIAEGQTSNQIEINSHQLEVLYADGVSGILPLQLESLPRREGMSPIETDLPKGRGKLQLLRFLPAAIGHSKFDIDTNGLPALNVKLEAPMASVDQWLWSGNQESSEWQVPMIGTLRLISIATDSLDVTQFTNNPADILLIASPSALHYRLKFDGSIKPVMVGQKFTVGSISLTVTDHKDRVVIRDFYEPANGREGNPALQFSVITPDGKSSGPIWVGYGSQVQPGNSGALFRMTARQHDLGFSVQLEKFKREFYPGTNQPASYASDVIVQDPAQGKTPFHISMNHPLVHRGWKFFQSSFIEGTPTYSILAVAYDPGTETVYIGCIALILGLIGIFFFKPYLKKKFPPPVKRSEGK